MIDEIELWDVYGLTFQEALEILSEHKRSPTMLHVLRTPVEDLPLSIRSANAIKTDGYIYVSDLVQKTENEMLRMPNFGRVSLKEVKEVLGRMGMHFGMKISPELQALLRRP